MFLRIVYGAPAHTEAMAVHAGADMAIVYWLKRLLMVPLMGAAEEAITEMNVRPYSDGAELE